ncbi:hypothetical protein GJAV_G00232940 [Gymnothorax javanicus]|nr:hypothetical protein GJAV_G00232940 [Gymnothorax javanicus]
MAYILVQWIEDPPSWDVLPAKKNANGNCTVNSICDISYKDETSPAKILQIGSRSTPLKDLETLERENFAPNNSAQECGHGQRKKWPSSRVCSPARSSDGDDEVGIQKIKYAHQHCFISAVYHYLF